MVAPLRAGAKRRLRKNRLIRGRSTREQKALA
jgi:hypothetical protein